MTERWAKVAQLFEAAQDLEGEERQQMLQRECGDDSALLEEVLALLREAEDSPDFLEEPTHLKEDSSVLGLATPDPTQIGRYRVLDKIGEGGMGIVYRVEQDNPRRQAALKIIKPGVTGEEGLRRFEHETQVLGLLQHPGIAQIFEAGTADLGNGPQPYFAMEYIEGKTLLEYAQQAELSDHARLEVLAKICDAIHHAHQKGVVHRDLKPGNILIDGSGQPKVLDFGVARATDADVQATTLHTQVGQLIGTVQYMSPEQAAGDPHAIDTRSDVYSLGVVGFELLTGKLPHDFEGRLFHDAVRMVAEEDPQAISTLVQAYRGDVETIIGKALAKEKERRYESARALAEDIRRYLQDEPILARPASTMYQLRKFAKRNQALVGGVVSFVLLLIVAVIVSTYLAIKATRSEADAERRYQLTRQLAKNYVELDEQLREKIGTTEIRASIVAQSQEHLNQLAAEKSNDPDLMDDAIYVLLRLGDMLGDPYKPNLGRPDEALEKYTEALNLCELRIQTDPDDADLILNRVKCHMGRARVFGSQRQMDEALAELELAERILDGAPQDSGPLRGRLAVIHEYASIWLVQLRPPQPDLALEYADTSIALRQRQLQETPDDVSIRRGLLTTNSQRANILLKLGKKQEAIELAAANLEEAEALTDLQDRSSMSQRDLAVCYGRYGDILVRADKISDGLVFLRKNQEICAKLHSADSRNLQAVRDFAVSSLRLGELLRRSDPAEAERLLQSALSVQEDWYDSEPDNPLARADLSRTSMTLAQLLMQQRRWEDGLRVAQRAEEVLRLLAEPWNEQPQWALFLARMIQRQGRCHGEAGRLPESIETLERSLGVWDQLTKLSGAPGLRLEATQCRQLLARQTVLLARVSAGERQRELFRTARGLSQTALNELAKLGNSRRVQALVADCKKRLEECNQALEGAQDSNEAEDELPKDQSYIPEQQYLPG